MDASEAKRITKGLGADLCGIAPAGRFDDAPDGFHPHDTYDACKSVLVFARRVPSGVLFASSSIPYTHVNDMVKDEIDRISYLASLELEKAGVRAVAVPADDPSEYWEADRRYARGILSLRHAGYLAGLGVLGRNTLLKNVELGNMILLGAILLDAELEPDPIVTDEPCPPDCSICLDACPPKALDGKTTNQELCRPLSNFVNERGFKLYRCWACRQVCPDALGIKE